MQVTWTPAVDTDGTSQVPFPARSRSGERTDAPNNDAYCNVKLKVSTPCTFTGTPESSVGLKIHCRAA